MRFIPYSPILRRLTSLDPSATSITSQPVAFSFADVSSVKQASMFPSTVIALLSYMRMRLSSPKWPAIEMAACYA